MKAVFETKEFLEMEREEKQKILEVLLASFEGCEFEKDIQELENKKQDLELTIANNKEQIFSLQSKVSKIDSLDQRKGQVLVELEEVKRQSGVFKQKQAELEKNKNALELKTSLQKKNALAFEIEGLKNELEELREQKIEKQNSLVEIRANFDKFYDTFNEEIAGLLLKEKMIATNAHSERNEEAAYNEFKDKQQIASVSDEILIIKENIERFTMKCHAVEAEIQEKTDELKDIAIPEESRELIVQAKDLESEIIIFDEMLARLDKLLDSTKADVDDAKALYSHELAIERKREDELEKIDKSTSKVFENSELSNFEKLRNCDKSLADMYVVEYEIGLVDKRIEEINKNILAKTSQIEELKTKIDECTRLFEEKERIVHETKEILKERQEDRESLLGNNHLSMLVEYTNIGDNCPVCRAKVHEKNYTPKTDLAGINKEVEMAQNRVLYAEKDRDAVLVMLASYKSKLDFENSQIEFEKEEIKHLEDSKIKIYQRVVDVNSQMIENFGSIKNALKKTAGALEDLIELQYDLKESVQENIAKKTEYGSRISLLSEKYEQLLDLYFVLQKERAEREMLLLEAKSTVDQDDFEEKRQQFSDNEKLAELMSENIIELYQQLSELKTSIMVENEKLAELEYKRGKLETRTGDQSGIQFEIDDDVSIQDIEEKIDRLKESHKHLLLLKNDAETSVQNTLKDYEIKTKLLASKIDDFQDISALVGSLVFRYGFADENDANNYITTDNMIKLKEGEIKIFNNRLAKLEAEYSLLSETGASDSTTLASEIAKLQKENEECLQSLGQIQQSLDNLNENLRQYNQIVSLLKNN